MDNKTREFLESLVKAFDEIAGRITYFISFSDGVSDSQKPESDCSTPEQEDFMKYKGVKITKRKDGRWYSRIVIKPGHYKIIYGRTQMECYEKTKAVLDKPRLISSMRRELEKKERELTDISDKLPSKRGRCKLKDWYAYWMRTYKVPNCRDSTVSYMRYVYNNHISKLGELNLDEINGIVIQSFLAEIPTSGIRKKAYTILKDMLRKAYAAELIKRDPFLGVVPPKHKNSEQRALEPAEQERFLERAKDSEYYPIYALMLFEGLRTAEAKAIRHCDIKEDHIVVRAALSDKNEIGDTKTGNIRRVPIFARFRPIADALRSDSTALISGRRPNKHTANDEYREIMKELGMDYNMYSLRHTFATNCARAGINTKQVSLWMGHSNVTMTLKYYTNISDSFEKESVRKFDTNTDTNLKGKPQ